LLANQDIPTEDFFRALEVERTQALVARDMPTIERLHASCLVAGNRHPTSR